MTLRNGFAREHLIDCIFDKSMKFSDRKELITILERDGRKDLRDLKRLGETRHISQYNINERKKAIEALKRSLAEDK